MVSDVLGATVTSPFRRGVISGLLGFNTNPTRTSFSLGVKVVRVVLASSFVSSGKVAIAL